MRTRALTMNRDACMIQRLSSEAMICHLVMPCNGSTWLWVAVEIFNSTSLNTSALQDSISLKMGAWLSRCSGLLNPLTRMLNSYVLILADSQKSTCYQRSASIYPFGSLYPSTYLCRFKSLYGADEAEFDVMQSMLHCSFFSFGLHPVECICLHP